MFLKLFVPVVALLISQNALAQACYVPVCDIPGTIQALKVKTTDDRQMFLSDLYQAQVNAKDAAVLRNLHDFGFEAYKLAQELNDPKVILKWAADIRQIGQGLLTYADFHKDEFIATYKETATIPELTIASQQRVRFSALYRWKLEVPVLFDIKTVYEVYDYISAASALSKKLNDEDYIIREANMVLELLSARVSYLYPLYEGVFAIKANCIPVATDCEQKDTHSDRLVVMNSLTDLDVYTSLAISKETSFLSSIGVTSEGKTPEINFLFVKSLLEKNGTALYSKSDVLTVGVRPSEIKADFSGNQDVVGNAVTTRNTGALNFAGSVVFSPLKYYVDQLPELLAQQPITGEFVGRLGEYPVRLIIRQRVDKTLMATAFVVLNKKTAEVTKIDFTMGQYVSHRQLINLTGVGQVHFTPYKMTAAYRLGADQKLHWFGGFYSATGYVKDVAFDYVGPVTDL
jgi:hypothetical protein